MRRYGILGLDPAGLPAGERHGADLQPGLSEMRLVPYEVMSTVRATEPALR